MVELEGPRFVETKPQSRYAVGFQEKIGKMFLGRNAINSSLESEGHGVQITTCCPVCASFVLELICT